MDEQAAAKGKDSFSKWIMLMVAVVIVGAFIYVRSGHSGAGIVWGENYAAGLTEAKDQNKAVLLAFSTSWCPSCVEMKKTTYQDANVKAFVEEHFTPIHLDAEQESALADKYGLQYLPTYYVLKSDGQVMRQFTGYYAPEEFIGELQQSLGKS